MPCVTLHCLVHLLPPSVQKTRFPAIHTIRYSPPTDPDHYSLASMIVWSTAPYALWQLAYHFLITVRRREKIAAGRPTSFTWLRKSYAKTWLGKIVLSLPEALQEPAFMLIQYSYALLTMVPCPVWFWYRWPSAIFLMGVFTWSVYNGAVYYIDVFGTRFQKELDQLRRDVARYQVGSPELAGKEEGRAQGEEAVSLGKASMGVAAEDNREEGVVGESATRTESGKSQQSSNGLGASGSEYSLVDQYARQPATGSSTGVQEGSREGIRERG